MTKKLPFVLVCLLCFALHGYAQQEESLAPSKSYQIGFFAGIAYDDLTVLSGMRYLDKDPRIGFAYGISFSKNPNNAFHMQYQLSYAEKGFLQNTGSRYGNNALYSAHYIDAVPSICFAVRPKVELQIGLGATLKLAEAVLSDEADETIEPRNQFFPKSAFIFEPAIQFGKGIFVGRLSYNALLFSPFVVDVSMDGSTNMARVRQERIAFSVGYFFTNTKR